MTKPTNNNLPCVNGPDSNNTTVEEPQAVEPLDVTSQRSVINGEEIVQVEHRISDDQKKRVCSERSIKNLQGKLEWVKGKLDYSEATRIAASKKHKGEIDHSEAARIAASRKHKGEIDGLKIKEKFAIFAASTSSKLVADATKEVIGSKAETIRDLRKTILELNKQIKEGKVSQAKTDKIRVEFDILSQEKSFWRDEKRRLTRSCKTLQKQVNDQLLLKYKHQQTMAEFGLQVKQVALEQMKLKQKNSDEKSEKDMNAKKEFQTWNFQQREIQKEKESQRREETKDKKAKKVADRLQIVSSEMLRTNRLNGGTFPNPGMNLQQVRPSLF
jgi:hypothetical protein